MLGQALKGTNYGGGFVVLLFLMLTAIAWGDATESQPIAVTNACKSLNYIENNGKRYRQAFDPITPLIRTKEGVEAASCPDLLDEVQNPSKALLADLPRYQETLNRFFANYCHRDTASGWKYDIQVRDTGPYIQQLIAGKWYGQEHGTHGAVVIWYSPAFYEFLQHRADGDDAFVMPEGAMAVKEMYAPPSSSCRGEDPINLKPSDSGIAFFVRHSEASLDGWYWGSYGWSEFPRNVSDLGDQAAVDQYFADVQTNLQANQSWQSADGRPGAATITFGAGAGWGTDCLDCHASARSYQTFGDLKNITGGSPDNPINTYLSMNFPTEADPVLPKHARQRIQRTTKPNPRPPGPAYHPEFLKTFDPGGIFLHSPSEEADRGTAPGDETVNHLPSASFDTVWVAANPAHERAGVASQYITSDQCFGCHDAGQTGVQYDMSTNDPDSKEFIDQSPYGTWRTSPMGLAGRDPIFFAQLASETQTFHNEEGIPDLVENVCLGCHGILGQRQFNLDHALENEGDCGEFTRDMVNQIPMASGDVPAGKHPGYGALARDGISCASCHHAIFKAEDIDQQFDVGKPNAQNKCLIERQKFLNPGVSHNTLAATFSGNFLVGKPDELAAQFESPKEKPMQNSLGLTPRQDHTFNLSDVCGTCHTVHLTILQDGKSVGTVFEQTTYPEWAFSEFRTGNLANYPHGMGPLPSGRPAAGELRTTCQQCHMESSVFEPHEDFPEGLVFPVLDPDRQFVSKIATIQEVSNYPRTDNTLPASEIDLEWRQGFARHTLVGLNVFFMSMAKQFPEVLGIPRDARGYDGGDPLGETVNVPFIDRTLRRMKMAADSQTATIDVESAIISGGVLEARVKLASGVGHKFPSGVGFRRAFVEFRVLDKQGDTLWGSGTTNGAGVIMDNAADPSKANPIAGELWWDDECNAMDDRLAFQPHFDTGPRAVSKQSEAQIYQELVMGPPKGYPLKPEVPGQWPAKTTPVEACGTHLEPGDDKHGVYPGWNLTTSFLSICAQAKDNRLLPQGYLPLEDRIAIANTFTVNPGQEAGENAAYMAEKLAREGGSWGVDGDPDYHSVDGQPYGGGDHFEYAIPTKDIKGRPASVRASLYYQAIPPFYLQDRFCTARGEDRDRLYYLAGKLQLDEVAPDWKLPIDSSQQVVTRVR